MTLLLILIFGIQPTTAIGTDIFYSAATKTVGGWHHLRMKTPPLASFTKAPRSKRSTVPATWRRTRLAD